MPNNAALNRIASRPVEETPVYVEPELDALEMEMVAPPEGVVKETANPGALQGPLQGNEQLGGAMSSAGVRPAAVPAKKPVAPVVKKPVAQAKKPAPKPKEASKETYIAPRPPNILQRSKAGVIVTKGADGKRLLMMITTNSYRDREKEAIATKALGRYVEKAWGRVEDKCLPDNTLRFWHNGDIGDVVYADMEGPFLIEVAKERPNKVINLARPGDKPFRVQIKEVWDYLEENPDNIDWGASHGFKFYKGQRDSAGVYQKIYKFESSVLPLQWAANPYTFSGVVDMEPRDKLLQQLVGRANAKALRQGARQLKKALDVRGVAHKEVKAKGLLDDLEEKIAEMLGELTDDPAKAKQLQGELMETIADCLANGGEPDGDEIDPSVISGSTEGDQAAGYHYDAVDGEEEKEDDGESNEIESAAMKKSLKSFDALIESQGVLLETADNIAARLKSFEQIPVTVERLEARLKQLETQLKGRPRAASEADETVVEDGDMLSRVKKAMANYDPFFGVHVEGE